MLPLVSSQKLNEAVDALNSGDLSRALGIASQLRAMSPSPQALYVELMAMVGLGMVNQSQRVLRKHKDFLEQWEDGRGMSYHVQGRIAVRQGKPEVAVPLLRAACQLLAKNQSCVIDYAEALFHTAQFQQAHDTYTQAMLLGPATTALYNNLAACAMRLQNFEQAFAYNYAAWQGAPSGGLAQKIGHAFMIANNVREAAKHFYQALQLGHRTVETYHGLAEACFRLRLYRRAVRYLNAGLAIANPQQQLPLVEALGRCYEKMGEVLAWLPFSQRLIEWQPNNVAYLLNMGNACQMQGKYDEALEWADKAEQVEANHPDVIYFRGFINLLKGNWIEGYQGYEWRWKAIPFREKYGAVVKPLTSPMWDGVADLNGKLVMALCEQGAGDLIQFGLYVKNLVDRGAIVDLLAPPSMTELMMTMPWVRQVHDNYFKIPPHDYHISLMTMPLIEKTTVDTIPVMEKPLLRAPRKRERFSEQFTVALSWYGDAKHSYDGWRSMPTHFLHALIKAFPNVQFVSLQMAPHDRTLTKYIKAGLLIDGMEGATSFTDTAAAIDACDLVISVDTATAHLAAAMHKPVWMLISTYFDWRWLGGDSSTRWYPTMRIFRQTRTHDWRELLARVAEALQPMVALTPIISPASRLRLPEAPVAASNKKPAAPRRRPSRLKQVLSGERVSSKKNS